MEWWRLLAMEVFRYLPLYIFPTLCLCFFFLFHSLFQYIFYLYPIIIIGDRLVCLFFAFFLAAYHAFYICLGPHYYCCISCVVRLPSRFIFFFLHIPISPISLFRTSFILYFCTLKSRQKAFNQPAGFFLITLAWIVCNYQPFFIRQ